MNPSFSIILNQIEQEFLSMNDQGGISLEVDPLFANDFKKSGNMSKIIVRVCGGQPLSSDLYSMFNLPSLETMVKFNRAVTKAGGSGKFRDICFRDETAGNLAFTLGENNPLWVPKVFTTQAVPKKFGQAPIFVKHFGNGEYTVDCTHFSGTVKKMGVETNTFTTGRNDKFICFKNAQGVVVEDLEIGTVWNPGNVVDFAGMTVKGSVKFRKSSETTALPNLIFDTSEENTKRIAEQCKQKKHTSPNPHALISCAAVSPVAELWKTIFEKNIPLSTISFSNIWSAGDYYHFDDFGRECGYSVPKYFIEYVIHHRNEVENMWKNKEENKMPKQWLEKIFEWYDEGYMTDDIIEGFEGFTG
jgi:hypothetical protein